MNNNKRFLLGLASTLLLACGFIRAAERLDPMTAMTSPEVTQRGTMACTTDCVGSCYVEDDGN